MQRWKPVIVSSLIVVSGIGFVAAEYEPTAQDQRFVEQLQDEIDEAWQNAGKERGIYLLAKLQEGQELMHGDDQAVYILEQLEDYSFQKLEDYSVASRTQKPRKGELVASPSPSPAALTTAVSKEHFFQTYSDHVAGQITPPERCIKHYEFIDEIAREHNFPTPLIIATWRREHSCFMTNPSNEMGLFQIRSHTYPPGEIGLEQLEQQVEHFIAFAWAKRDYYDAIQKFDQLPIGLAYTAYDLRSIQKHAVMYNGAYSGVTPDNSTYANENFGTGETGRDGIVAMFLKVLGWELKNL